MMKMKFLLLIIIVVLGIAPLTIAQNVPAYVPSNGLVGWWPFNGNANDESGNGNDGTPVGATLSTDRYSALDSAYFFDGNSEINCGSNNSLNINEFTFSYWVFLSDISLLYQTILAKYDKSDYGSFATGIAENKAEVWLTKDSTSFVRLLSNETLEINHWYNIIVTHSVTLGTNIYLNGVLSNSDNTAFNLLQAPFDNFRIGSQGPFYPVAIQNGKIDDIGVWNRVLNQQEINTLFTTPTLGITDVSQNNLYSVYPNPSTNRINLKVDAKLFGSIYTINDNSGKIVLSGKINSVNTIIELGNLSGGTYLLSIGENLKQTFKIRKE